MCGGETGLLVRIAVSGVKGGRESDVETLSKEVSIVGTGGRSFNGSADFRRLLAIVDAFDGRRRLAIVDAFEPCRDTGNANGKLGPVDFGLMNLARDRVVVAVDGRVGLVV